LTDKTTDKLPLAHQVSRKLVLFIMSRHTSRKLSPFLAYFLPRLRFSFRSSQVLKRRS